MGFWEEGVGVLPMEDRKKVIFAEERKHQILELLGKNQKIVVPELCSYFGVSPSTIRNDLRDLKEAGLITRTHGGAISNTKVSLEPPPSAKESLMSRQKQAIAQAAADLVDDQDIIALCTGTTTLELARQLAAQKKKLTVVLNDIRIASFLEEHSDFTLFMLGGIIRKGFHYVNTIGNPLPHVRIDKMFFSCNGLNASMGATVPDFHLAANVASIMELANETVLLCDSSKVGSVAFAQIAPLSKISTIILDNDTDPVDLKELESADSSNLIIAALD